MVIAVTGASGFIGRALVRAANERGWRVIALPRTIERGMLEGCDAVVHLAGESVAGRWTPQKKGGDLPLARGGHACARASDCGAAGQAAGIGERVGGRLLRFARR